MLLTKRAAIVTIIGLYASTQLLLGQTTNRSATDPSPIPAPDQDSDRDGLLDDVDPDPLIASYSALKWDVTSVRLDYDVRQPVRASSGGSREQAPMELSKGSFSWLLGADGRIEGGVRAKASPSADPLELFGVERTAVDINTRIAGSASVRSQRERMTDEMAQSAMKTFLAITDETAMGNFQLSFSVNIRSPSGIPLSVRLASIPVLISGRQVANADPSDVSSPDSVIEIPADRSEGILVSFRAEIKNMKAVDLVRCLRNGDSPTLDLEHSRITIKAKNDPSEADLVSKINPIALDDCLLTVRTQGGSVAWRIAPTFGLKPVTLRQAMTAINNMLRREAQVDQDFFRFGITGRLRNIAGFAGTGTWLRVAGQDAAPVGVESIDTAIPKGIQFSLLEANMLADSAQEVMKAQGLDAERRAIEGMRIDLSLWKAAAEANWPEGIYLLGKCHEHGVEVPKDANKAFILYRKAADSDWTSALVAVAECYRGGRGVAKDDAEAVKWYRKAAEQGLAHAQNILGLCYSDGVGVPKDDVEAFKWFRKAAEQGDPAGQNRLGFCYANGQGVLGDEAEAVRWFRKAADQGYPKAQDNLGFCYGRGFGVSKDEAEAVKWFRRAAEQGLERSQNALGLCYSAGFGVSKDEAEAVMWFRGAAEQGHAAGQNNLGSCYANGLGVSKDDVEAVKWFRKAAEQGDAAGQNNLGLCYSNGRGVTKNDVEAVKWYRRAAEQGHAAAQNNLGFYYQHGLGVSKDEAEAVNWFRKAAAQGDAAGRNNLGCCYANGLGVSKDDVEAVKWYSRAADQGDAAGQYNLGSSYYRGRGVGKDDAEAVKWFRKAAEQGYASAQYELGYCYHNGRGVSKDDAEAVKWFRKAAEQGYERAKDALNRLGT